jgi:hypothetical protein
MGLGARINRAGKLPAGPKDSPLPADGPYPPGRPPAPPPLRPDPGPTPSESSLRVPLRCSGSARVERTVNVGSNGPRPKPRRPAGLPQHPSDKEVRAQGGEHGSRPCALSDRPARRRFPWTPHPAIWWATADRCAQLPPLRRPTTTHTAGRRRRRQLADPTATAANPIGRRSATTSPRHPEQKRSPSAPAS